MDQITTEVPFKHFRDITDSLNRYSGSLLMQLRTGHIPLNSYLHRQRLRDSPECTLCENARPETIDHFLMECPAHEEHRPRLRRAIHAEGMLNPVSCLDKPEKAKAIIVFVKATGRLPKDRANWNRR